MLTLFHRNPHSGERRYASDNRYGGEDEQNVLQLQRNRIILNDVAAGAVAETDETDVLLKQYSDNTYYQA